MAKVAYVPWLHMHQPPVWQEGECGEKLVGNLFKMITGPPNSEESWNGRIYARSYKNAARYALQLAAEGVPSRIILDFSGCLLKEIWELSSSGFFDALEVEGEKIGSMISLYREVLEKFPETIEVAGTSYFHNYFPVSPRRDWEAQVQRWRDLYGELFGEEALRRVKGFWLPEMGVPGEKPMAALIRVLKQAGYQWLILPPHVLQAQRPMDGGVFRLVCEDEEGREEITAVVRDTQMGIRQQEGCDSNGIYNDLRWKRDHLFKEGEPLLVVPTSDGENGNAMMFRFFSETFAPFFRSLSREEGIESLSISEYLERYCPEGPREVVKIRAEGGSWIGGHDSWQRSGRGGEILTRIEEVSRLLGSVPVSSDPLYREAEEWVLRCQTSCYVYWGQDFWFHQAEKSLQRAEECLLRLGEAGRIKV